MDLSRLNEPQRQAVLHGEAPLLVLAGAGTGKTTVITYRIASLIERGVEPQRLLAVTFTNKAAREMRDRAALLTGCDARALHIGTFHATCARILRTYADRLGLSPHFVIYDEDDQLRLLRQCGAELKLDPQVYPPRVLRHHIEQWKNAGKRPGDVEPASFDPMARVAREVYELYQRRSREADAVDFGDLLLHAVTLLRRDEGVRDELRRRWTHLLVDEYQDTNPVQYQLLRELSSERHNVTVVGDDDQSIYRWRGADVGNILRFERDFPGACIIRLEQNYRSTQTILSAANAVIARNVARKGKTLFTAGAQGAPLRVRMYDSERDEGEAVAEAIGEALRSGIPAADVAVLYRTNAQSRPIEEALRRRRLPYAIYGGMRFYDRQEVKDALAYLRLLVNPRSNMDFMRVVNAPARGLGKTSIERLTELAIDHGCPLLEAAQHVASGEGDFRPRARASLRDFVALMADLAASAATAHPARLLEEVLSSSGYLEALRIQGTEEAEQRRDNLQELVAALDEYVALSEAPSLAAFLEDAALASDLDGLADEREHVSLMTLHSAKGLEFRVVFLPGLEEGLFPHSRSLDERAALEEERRLCYVGLTRAKDTLVLSAARCRSVFGELRVSQPSRFLAELPPELLDVGAMRSSAVATPSSTERVVEIRPALRYERGCRVFHASFGDGLVLECEGAGRDEKLTIDFPSVGRKVVVARFVERR